MNTVLEGLRICRAELANRITEIDAQILAELDRIIGPGESKEMRSEIAIAQKPVEAKRLQGETVPSKKGDGRKSKKSDKKSSRKRRKGQTWSDKILMVLGKSNGQGMSTSDILKAFAAAEQSEGRSIKPATINTTLMNMESRGKSIRVERNASGRKMHYAL